MRLLLQRVSRASVTVEGGIVGQIGPGLLALAGFGQADTDEILRSMLRKTLNLRIFSDDEGKMNRSLLEMGGELLVVSQFTLYADCRKGRRPSFIDAASPDRGRNFLSAFWKSPAATKARASASRRGALAR
jgi:D-tyrosyl-tRNA(Tyr) deacylase